MALQDLNERFPIVDPNTGRATIYLLRLLRDSNKFSGNLDDLIEALQETVDTIDETQFTAGTGLGGGGVLGNDDPISYNLDAVIDELNDVDTTTTTPSDGDVLTWVNANSAWEPVAPSGGGGGGLTLISSQLLGSSTATVSFSSIASTYSDLELTINGRGTAASNFNQIRVRFNSDTGSNYSYSRVNRFGNTTVNAATFIEVGSLAGGSATAGHVGGAQIILPGYKDTTLHKSANGTAGAFRGADTLAGYFTGGWKSTSAINAIDVFLDSGSFAAGSRLSLYGRG